MNWQSVTIPMAQNDTYYNVRLVCTLTLPNYTRMCAYKRTHHWQHMLVDMYIRLDTYYFSCTGSYYSCTGSHINTCQCEHELIRNTKRVHLPCTPTLSHCNYTHECIHTHAQHPPFPHRQQCTTCCLHNHQCTMHATATTLCPSYSLPTSVVRV